LHDESYDDHHILLISYSILETYETLDID